MEAALAHAQQHLVLSDAQTGISQRLTEPRAEGSPVLMTLAWWHHPCTQQRLRLNSAEQKPWLAAQQQLNIPSPAMLPISPQGETP